MFHLLDLSTFQCAEYSFRLILSILRICGHLFSFLFSAQHVYRILSVVSSSVLWYETSVLFERIWSKLLGTLRHQFWKVGKLRLGAEGRGKSDTARTWRADGTLCRLLPHRPPLLNAPATRIRTPVATPGNLAFSHPPPLAGFRNGLRSIYTAQSDFPFTLAQVEKVFAQQESSLGCLLLDWWYLWLGYSHLLACLCFV